MPRGYCAQTRRDPASSPPGTWQHAHTADAHVTTDTRAPTQVRDGHSDATDTAAWQGQASGQTAGPAEPPDIGSRLLQIEVPRVILGLVPCGHLLL